MPINDSTTESYKETPNPNDPHHIYLIDSVESLANGAWIVCSGDINIIYRDPVTIFSRNRYDRDTSPVDIYFCAADLGNPELGYVRSIHILERVRIDENGRVIAVDTLGTVRKILNSSRSVTTGRDSRAQVPTTKYRVKSAEKFYAQDIFPGTLSEDAMTPEDVASVYGYPVLKLPPRDRKYSSVEPPEILPFFVCFEDRSPAIVYSDWFCVSGYRGEDSTLAYYLGISDIDGSLVNYYMTYERKR